MFFAERVKVCLDGSLLQPLSGIRAIQEVGCLRSSLSLAASSSSRFEKVMIEAASHAETTDVIARQLQDNDSTRLVQSRPPLVKGCASRRTLSDKAWGAPQAVVPTPDSNILVPMSAWGGRDMSDLSESCMMNGNIQSRPTADTLAAYLSRQSTNCCKRPWTQATILSSRQPSHPQPPTDCDDSVAFTKKKFSHDTLLYQNEQGILIETVMSSSSRRQDVLSAAMADDDDVSQQHGHRRTPIIILLMDPSRHLYELMQLWIDSQVDAVRDIVHAVQQHLSGKPGWTTDYDGLFQVRNHVFTQLIHVVGMSRHNPQPYEVFVAKPWSMTSKESQSHATELLQYLQNIKLLQTRMSTLTALASSPITLCVKENDLWLCLGKEARTRIYVPEGILSHYHACQFLSFSPPFEQHRECTMVGLDVLGGRAARAAIDDDDSLLTESICEVPDDDALDELPQLQPCLATPVAKEPEIIRSRPTIFHPAYSGDLTRAMSDVSLTIKSIQRHNRNPFANWNCCRSRRQLHFVSDGGQLPTSFDCATPPMEESAHLSCDDDDDDASEAELSYASASLPLMFGRSTQTTQEWTQHVIEN